MNNWSGLKLKPRLLLKSRFFFIYWGESFNPVTLEFKKRECKRQKTRKPWNHRDAVCSNCLWISLCVLTVHHAAPAQPAALRLWIRPNGSSGRGDHAQHGEAHPAVAAVHRLLQEHIRPARQPSLLHPGLHPGRAPDEDSVLGNWAQSHLQVWHIAVLAPYKDITLIVLMKVI